MKEFDNAFHVGNGEVCSYVSQMKKFVHVFLVENEKVYSCVSGGK